MFLLVHFLSGLHVGMFLSGLPVGMLLLFFGRGEWAMDLCFCF